MIEQRITVILPHETEFELVDEMVHYDARSLRDRVAAMPSFESAVPDPVTVGAIILVVLQSVLPKVLDVLAKRQQTTSLKIRLRRGDQSVEVECTGPITPEQIRQAIDALSISQRAESEGNMSQSRDEPKAGRKTESV